MSKYPVSPEKESQLTKAMSWLGIDEQDLVEKFIRGSGPGGQKINKTASTVYLMHRPSGIEVKCQQGRSQAMNRYYARKELCEKLEERILGEQSARQQAREKIRRQVADFSLGALGDSTEINELRAEIATLRAEIADIKQKSPV